MAILYIVNVIYLIMSFKQLEIYLYKHDYRESSIKTILTGVQRIINNVGIDHLDDLKSLKEFLDSLDSPSVKPALTHNLMLFWTANKRPNLVKQLEPLYQQYKQELMRSTHHQLPKSKEKFISLEKLAELSQQLRSQTENVDSNKVLLTRDLDKQLHWWIKYLLVTLYAYVVPVRLEEYRTMTVQIKSQLTLEELIKWSQKQQINVLSMSHGVMISSHYKTSKRHQVKVIKLGTYILQELNRWITWRRRWGFLTGNGYYLLITNDQQPWKPSSLLMLLTRTIGQGITVNYLRKSVIADLLHYWKKQESAGKISHERVLKYRHKLARLMGHQYQTQELVYAGYQFMVDRGQWSADDVIKCWITDNLD